MDFAVQTDHRVKIKENEKKNKYLDLARELKRLWNLRVAVIPTVGVGHRTVSKELGRGLGYLKIKERIEPS